MKKAEAISILATSVRPREAKDRARYDEAVKMAIEALKCSEILNNSDTISRQAAIDAVGFYSLHSGDKLLFADKPLKDLPSAQSEQTKMIIKEIRKWINSGNRGSADYFIVDKIEEIINKYE